MAEARVRIAGKLTRWGAAPPVVDEAADDEALAVAASTDRAAFGVLYRRHANSIYRFLLARVGSPQDAQDLTAQTFLAALEGIDRYRSQGKFKAWLMGIARRKVADHWRKKRPLPLDGADDLQHPAPGPESEVSERLRVERLVAAMQALSADRAEAVALRIFGGLSAAEVGAVMGRSEAAAKMLVFRAVRDLRERLGDDWGMDI